MSFLGEFVIFTLHSSLALGVLKGGMAKPMFIIGQVIRQMGTTAFF
jgi:hypothetical protein